MACEHKRLRCTDNVFYCLDCGEKIIPSSLEEAKNGPKEAATEPKKRKPRKKED